MFYLPHWISVSKQKSPASCSAPTAFILKSTECLLFKLYNAQCFLLACQMHVLFPDLDECISDLLHSCNDTTLCRNLVGTYLCECAPGKALNPNSGGCEGKILCPDTILILSLAICYISCPDIILILSLVIYNASCPDIILILSLIIYIMHHVLL